MKLNVKELEMLIRKETAAMKRPSNNTVYYAPVWDIKDEKYYLCDTSNGKKCEHIKDGFDSYSDAIEALIQMRKEVRWEDTELKSEELF